MHSSGRAYVNGVKIIPAWASWTAALAWGLSRAPQAIRRGGFRYGLLGWKGFLLSGVEYDSILPLFFFAMVAMSIAATIPTGAMAERWSWRNFCLFGIWFVLLFSIHANWVWGGGWLAQAGVNWKLGSGVVDFAGSGAIHALGGVVALAVLGPSGQDWENINADAPNPSPAIMSPWSWPAPWCWL